MSDQQSKEIIFAPARRENVTPLIGQFAKSGGGKTLSSLLLARGIVGPKGRIAVTDTENKRAEYFADDPRVAPYNVSQLREPFTPEAYLEQHRAACQVADIWIVDSMTHEWTGAGGCLEMVEKFLDDKAGNDWTKRDKYKMPAWGKVSPRHEALVAALMRSPIPVICCFRAKDKVLMEKEPDPNNPQREKTRISLDHDAPVARKDMIYEMTIAFGLQERELMERNQPTGEKAGGFFTIVKQGPPSLYRAVMAVKEEQIGIAHGEAIAAWCKNPALTPIAAGTVLTQQSGSSTQKAGSKPDSEVKKLKKELWELTKAQHLDDPGKLSQYLLSEDFITDTESLEDLGPARLAQIIAAVKTKQQTLI